MVYFNYTNNSVYPVCKWPSTLCTPFLLLKRALHILGLSFPTSIFLLGGNVLEIMLKNIFECLKFILNLLHLCTWVALSEIAVWIDGGGEEMRVSHPG